MKQALYRIFDFLFYAFAALGLVASCAVAIIYLIEPSVTNDWLNNLTIVNFGAAIFATFCFAIYYSKLTENLTPSQVGILQYAGCPQWMRAACTVLVVAGILMFFSSKILEVMGYAPPLSGSTLPPSVSAGLGLIVHAALPAQIYSIRHST